MTRVLVTDFDAIVGLGVREVLIEGGCDVISSHQLLDRALIVEVRPDALVVDMDDHATVSRAEALVGDFPGMPLVECSSSIPLMRVFPGDGTGESFEVLLSAADLIQAVTRQPNKEN